MTNPPESPSAKPTLPLLLGVVGGWLLFTLMVTAISWGGGLVRGRPIDVGVTLLWNFGWILWAAGTFVVIRLARRFPIERPRLGRGLAAHAGLGVVVSLGMLAVEFLFNLAIERFWPGAPRANAFLGFIVYKFHVYFLIYWMIVGATRAYDLHSKYRASELLASQLEARLAQAQLQALKAQLHPHFLFNTHHAIISLMLKQDNASAIQMLTQLSDLLRLTLRQTEQQLGSLREELDALELYLGIQKKRYGDRLTVEIDVDPAILTTEVPCLLLQPIVENALKHGIDALAGGGRLRITARVFDSRLELRVGDNGPGFPAGFALETSRGIGLRNTAARLARLYGSAQNLQWQNHSGSGAEVAITIPCRAFQPSAETAAVAVADE